MEKGSGNPVLHAKNKLAVINTEIKTKMQSTRKEEVNSTPEERPIKSKNRQWNQKSGAAAKRTAEWIKNNRERQ